MVGKRDAIAVAYQASTQDAVVAVLVPSTEMIAPAFDTNASTTCFKRDRRLAPVTDAKAA
jgi:hypothetical protein